MSVRSATSIYEFMLSITRDRWLSKFSDESLYKSISNPLDFNEVVGQLLLSKDISIYKRQVKKTMDRSPTLSAAIERNKLLKVEVEEFESKLMESDIYIDVLDYAKAIGYDAKTVTKHWVSRGLLLDEHIMTRGDFIGSQLGNQLDDTWILSDPNTRGSNELRATRKYYNLNGMLPLMQNLLKLQSSNRDVSYDVTFLYNYIRDMMDFNKDLLQYLAMEMSGYIIDRLSDGMNELRVELKHIRRDNKEIKGKLDTMNTKIDNALPICSNDKNPRIVILCRKAEWRKRRYYLVGALKKDRRIKALLKDQDDYEYFKTFESINNPAMIKTNIVEKYKKDGGLQRCKITVQTDDDIKQINGIRLTDDQLKRFVADLRDKNNNYDVVVESDDDDGLYSCYSI